MCQAYVILILSVALTVTALHPTRYDYNIHESATATLPPADTNLNIYALPVGQGDCTVIQCPSGTGGISIIDAGSSKQTGFTKQNVLDYLKGQTIDHVLLTHPDREEISYIDGILNQHAKPVDVYHSCPWSSYAKYVKTTYAKPIRVNKCCGMCTAQKCTQSLSLCGGIASLNITGSEQMDCKIQRSKAGVNGDSIVSLVKYNKVKVLFAGDFEGSSKFIRDFLSCCTGYLKAQIYRLSLHGAYQKTPKANSPPILDAIGAKYVFSSSGLKLNYGHPRCDIYDYYKAKKTLVTGLPAHPYTCYGPYGEQYHSPTDAIYVTTVRDNFVVKNYVIKFAISSSGTITPSLTQV